MKLERVSWKVGRLIAVSFGIALLVGFYVGIGMGHAFVLGFLVSAIPTLILIVPLGLLFAVIANRFGALNMKTAVVTGIIFGLPLFGYFMLGHLGDTQTSEEAGGIAYWVLPLIFGSTPIVAAPLFYKFYLQHVYQPVKDTPSK
jgi:hypothetical protein